MHYSNWRLREWDQEPQQVKAWGNDGWHCHKWLVLICSSCVGASELAASRSADTTSVLHVQALTWYCFALDLRHCKVAKMCEPVTMPFFAIFFPILGWYSWWKKSKLPAGMAGQRANGWPCTALQGHSRGPRREESQWRFRWFQRIAFFQAQRALEFETAEVPNRSYQVITSKFHDAFERQN